MNDNTSADPDQEKVAPSEQEALARLTDTLANTKPTDSEQSRAQTHAANWTAGATVAIAFFTFVTIGVGIAQWRILSGTLAEMRDEQRPWLQVVVKLTGPLVNDGGTVKTNAGIEIKNIGHRPAMEVRATAQLAYRPKMFTPHSDRLGAFCTGEALSIWQWLSLDSGTDIVFPDGKDTISLDIQMDDFDVKYLKDIPTSSIGGDVTNNIDLMFCVSYKTIGEVTNHHPGGILSITSNGPEVIKRGQSLSLGSLKLTRPDFGPRNFAD